VPAVLTPARRRRYRPDKVDADKAYDHAANRAYLRRRGIASRIARRGIESSSRLGRHGWRIERTLSWLSSYRRLAGHCCIEADGVVQAVRSGGPSLFRTVENGSGEADRSASAAFERPSGGHQLGRWLNATARPVSLAHRRVGAHNLVTPTRRSRVTPWRASPSAASDRGRASRCG
jgi:hypothetical protein